MTVSTGSTWRRWDLHVHSPYSCGGSYELFCNRLEQCPADVIGVNDYCSIDGYVQVSKTRCSTGKPIFPVVEFRMSNLLMSRKSPRQGVRINFHIIFDNDPALIGRITNAMNALPCLAGSGQEDTLGNIAPDVASRRRVMVDYFKTIDHFDAHLGRHRFLVCLPYDEYGGIDEVNPETDAPFKVGMIQRTDFVGSANPKQRAFFLWQVGKYTPDQYKAWLGKRLPCIKGSDAHELDYPFGQLQDMESKPSANYCWIKSDPTFEGLRQVTREPEDRVCICEEPEVLSRVRSNATRFLQSVSIRKETTSTLDEEWFDAVELPLNPQLVAVIGNKGGGKSALLDIVGRIGGTKNMQYCSFLNENKFRKGGKAKQFVASLKWHSGDIAEANLGTNPEPYAVETIKYIPQQFLERLCNEEQNQFESELKAVVLSHMPESDRIGATSLDGLVEKQSQALRKRISSLHGRLHAQNAEIVSLEAQLDPHYRKNLEEKLEVLRRDLRSHTRRKPKEVASPKEDDDAKAIRSEVLKAIRSGKRDLKQLEDQIVALTTEAAANKRGLQFLREVRDEVTNLALDYDELRKKREKGLRELGIAFLDVAKLATDLEPLSTAQKPLVSRSREIRALLDPNVADSVAARAAKVRTRISELQQQLRGPEKQYEEYRQSMAEWEARRRDILGNDETPGTFKYVRSCIRYLDSQLIADLTQKRLEREQLVAKILEAKTEILDLYRQCYQPVTDFIARYKGTQEIYNIAFLVRFRVERLVERLSEYLNHGVKGTFYGANDGRKAIENLVSSRDFNRPDDLRDFQRDLIDCLEHDRREGEGNKERVIARQIKEGIVAELYNYLFGLEYLVPSYEIRMMGKSLPELSPGERGALLLIFYLLIDRSDIPLVIDQPEENLDNQSVYLVLVKFVRDAKRRRQVIIATHNPNIAVGCDAEQVIHTSIDKTASSRVTYLSGAIENSDINAKLVDVLEGTLPAFQLRDSKYTITKLAQET